MSKYHNRLTYVGDLCFHSKGEADRWIELKLAERAKQITNLRRQVRIPLHVNGKLVTTYVADYVYDERGKEIVEDWKGAVTKEFILKRKLYEAITGKEITITGAVAKRELDWMPRKRQNRRAA